MVVPFSFYLRISFLLPADSIFASPSLDVAFALSDFPPSVHSSLLSIAPKQMCCVYEWDSVTQHFRLE